MKESRPKDSGPYYRIMASVAFYLASTNSTFAGTLTFQREHREGLIRFGSKEEYRNSAIFNLKEMILSELVDYLKLEPALSNTGLSSEQIRQLALEVLKTEILDERLDGTDYYLKARLVADPEGLGQAIEFMNQIEGRLLALDKAREAADEALREVERLEREIRLAKAKVEAFQGPKIVADEKAPNLSDWFDRAARLFEEGKYKEAALLYTKILEVNEDNVSSLLNRGATYYKMGQYEKALRDFEKVVELAPFNAIGFNNRASTLVNLGDFHQALQDYSHAIELDEKYEEAYRNRGILYLKYIKDYERALEDFTHSVALNPSDPRPYLGRGIALSNLGRFEEALKDYDQVLSLGGNWGILFYNRANALLKLGRLSDAIEDYTAAIEKSPNKMAYYYNRGIAYGMAGMYSEAIADFDRVIEMAPEHPRAYVLRGLFHFKVRDTKRARADWTMAQDLGDDTAMRRYLPALET